MADARHHGKMKSPIDGARGGAGRHFANQPPSSGTEQHCMDVALAQEAARHVGVSKRSRAFARHGKGVISSLGRMEKIAKDCLRQLHLASFRTLSEGQRSALRKMIGNDLRCREIEERALAQLRAAPSKPSPFDHPMKPPPRTTALEDDE